MTPQDRQREPKCHPKLAQKDINFLEIWCWESATGQYCSGATAMLQASEALEIVYNLGLIC